MKKREFLGLLLFIIGFAIIFISCGRFEADLISFGRFVATSFVGLALIGLVAKMGM